MRILSAEMMKVVRSVRIMSCLLTHEFIKRLTNEPFIIFIQEDDEINQYNLRFLNAYLVNVKTRFENLN